MTRSSAGCMGIATRALWCLLHTDSYAACVLKAVNLGNDTDTTAAVAGGLAGLVYGADAIPAAWVDALQQRGMIEKMCVDLSMMH